MGHLCQGSCRHLLCKSKAGGHMTRMCTCLLVTSLTTILFSEPSSSISSKLPTVPRSLDFHFSRIPLISIVAHRVCFSLFQQPPYKLEAQLQVLLTDMAWVVRSLRRLQSAAPHSLRLLESRLGIRNSRNADIFVGHASVFKPNSSESFWVVCGASSRAFSTTTMVKSAASTTHEEVLKSAASTTHEEVLKGGSSDGTFTLAFKGSPRVVFILGGPGSGKGTQCQKIVDKFGFVHLSAGDLLRAEIQSGSEYGEMIKNMIKDGKIVPSEVTVRLLLRAMENSKGEKFLIDGFPRNDENRAVFERMSISLVGFKRMSACQWFLSWIPADWHCTRVHPFFDCPEDEMERRVLGRNQGRVDDNKETMQKRLKVFADFSVPVVKYYESMGKVHKVTATGSIDDIHTTIEPLFEQFSEAHSTGDTQYATGKFGRSPANN